MLRWPASPSEALSPSPEVLAVLGRTFEGGASNSMTGFAHTCAGVYRLDRGDHSALSAGHGDLN